MPELDSSFLAAGFAAGFAAAGFAAGFLGASSSLELSSFKLFSMDMADQLSPKFKSFPLSNLEWGNQFIELSIQAFCCMLNEPIFPSANLFYFNFERWIANGLVAL